MIQQGPYGIVRSTRCDDDPSAKRRMSDEGDEGLERLSDERSELTTEGIK